MAVITDGFHRTDDLKQAAIDGATLIAWGFKPGKLFRPMIEEANRLRAQGAKDDDVKAALQAMVPFEILLRAQGLPYGLFLDTENDFEEANLAGVTAHMDALMRVPTIVAGAVMPDACPSGTALGTIPVGGAVACEDAIHPGFHSADICCSVAMTAFDRAENPRRILDAVQAATHFGPGGRKDAIVPDFLPDIDAVLQANPFLRGLGHTVLNHFGTQGDGNHFAYVGQLSSTGQPVLVTHHGSRGLGAQLYKRGMAVAQNHIKAVAPRVPAHNAWLKASSTEGTAYWEALQFARAWTKASHFAIHDRAAKALNLGAADRFWNEHNFVFRREDGLYYHGKGATPSWAGFSPDDDGRTLIPLNMAEPILITGHRDRKEVLGFAPHGAGRNLSRSAFLRQARPELPEGIDVRFFCGKADLSELPQAYKNAASVRGQIAKYGLAEVIDTITPYGSIMAGDWEQDAPWRKKR